MIKFTIEQFAKEKHLTEQSALNLLSKLKKQHLITVSGGGRQKRIYTLYQIPTKPTNGFYDIVNKYSKEKLVPKFKHYVNGNYRIENAVIDGIKIGDTRTLDATKHLFRHINNWKLLMDLAKKEKVKYKVIDLYRKARKEVKCKTIPKRYLK